MIGLLIREYFCDLPGIGRFGTAIAEPDNGANVRHEAHQTSVSGDFDVQIADFRLRDSGAVLLALKRPMYSRAAKARSRPSRFLAGERFY
jgi:hypothetical protein